jgi:3-oxoadipate enol-lactonase
VAGSWAAIRDADLRHTLRVIDRPTLVIAGAHDTVTSARHGEEIAAAIADARLVVLPAVHLSNVERPQEFVDLIVEFLTETGHETPEGAAEAAAAP